MKLDLDIGLNLEFLQANKTPPLIGLDISSSSVKMVELSEAGKGVYRVERYAIRNLPKDSVTDGNITNPEAVSDAIRQTWLNMNTKVKNVALALPSSAVITKKITVPAGLREYELETQVEAEANQYIPFALDEVNLDFQVIGPSPNSPDESEVLIAASRKEKVEDRVVVAESAGLKAIVMDVESFATQTAFNLIAQQQLPNGGRDMTIAIVDIGATTMHLIVLHNNQTVYMREQAFGGDQLTQEIQRRFGLSSEEAELAKRQGGLPENFESEVLTPFRENLALEVARALQFFYSSTQFNRVDRILLGGGCAAIAGINENVTSRTQVHTQIANPFANMAVSQKIKLRQLTQDAPSLLIACGLAMRRFDPS